MFNAGKWVAEIISSLGSYNALQNFVTHKEAIEFHVNKFKIQNVTRDDGDDSNTNTENDKILKGLYISQFQEANLVYRKQMIVLIASYIEAIILDFLNCIFIAHPVRMYSYLNNDENSAQGKVDLKEVLEADNKNTLIKSLSLRAANIATRGKFKTSINNIEKISKQKLDSELSSKLNSLVELRNQIVHELADVNIRNKEVVDGFDCLSDLITNLGVIAEKNGVRVNNPHLLERE